MGFKTNRTLKLVDLDFCETPCYAYPMTALELVEFKELVQDLGAEDTDEKQALTALLEFFSGKLQEADGSPYVESAGELGKVLSFPEILELIKVYSNLSSSVGVEGYKKKSKRAPKENSSSA